jgi:hypothetical protein
MKTQKTHKTAVITDIKDVPHGFVQIAGLLSKEHPRRKHWQRILSGAHDAGHIRAVKLVVTTKDFKTGPVFVDPSEAMEYIRDYDRRVSDAAEAAEPPESDPPRGAGDGLLVEIRDTLVEILAALRERTPRDELFQLVHDES